MSRLIRRTSLGTILPQLLIGGVVLAAQIPSTPTVYAAKMISSGHNYPTVDINHDGLIELCVELHQRMNLDAIRQRHSWSEADLASRIERLKCAGLVKESSPGVFLPTFMVISRQDADGYLPVSRKVVQQGRDLIVKHLPVIREQVKEIPGLQERSYDAYSFFVLSDVLLDNWQINRVEQSLLGSERPLRDGNRYYFAIMEMSANQSKEAFGLYGNGGAVHSGNEIDVYGNDRYSGHTLISASDTDLHSWFPDCPDDKAFWPVLISRLTAVDHATNAQTARADMRSGMEKLGLIDHGKLNFLVLPRNSTKSLYDVAKIVAPDLEELLRSHEPTLRAAYAASAYKEETDFNEYFIWWYHFFYTRVTDQLAADGLLQIPSSGNVTYLISDAKNDASSQH